MPLSVSVSPHHRVWFVLCAVCACHTRYQVAIEGAAFDTNDIHTEELALLYVCVRAWCASVCVCVVCVCVCMRVRGVRGVHVCVCVCVCVCVVWHPIASLSLSLSLFHTHTHTHT